MDDIEEYKRIHKTMPEYGATSGSYERYACIAIDFLKPKTVLDYGRSFN